MHLMHEVNASALKLLVIHEHCEVMDVPFALMGRKPLQFGELLFVANVRSLRLNTTSELGKSLIVSKSVLQFVAECWIDCHKWVVLRCASFSVFFHVQRLFIDHHELVLSNVL